MFVLIEDGTLDTVVKCDACGEESRFNYAAAYGNEKGLLYRQFVEECCLDAEEDHCCQFDSDGEQEQGV